MSIAGGPAKAIDRALSIGCNAMQIFVKNNMQWFAPPFLPAEISDFCNHPRRSELQFVFGHTGYLINLAATNPETHAHSVRSLREELIRGEFLQLPFLVLHPGAHMGAGVNEGLQKIVTTLDGVFAELSNLKIQIALEITAGQGTCLGHTFEQLAFIIEKSETPERLCVCLDTAHLFAAGYDISTAKGVRETFKQFDAIIGSDRLAALHLNDSKTILNSRVDRHDNIGHGKMGLEPFRYLMTEKRFLKIPKILETPKGKDLAEDRDAMELSSFTHEVAALSREHEVVAAVS